MEQKSEGANINGATGRRSNIWTERQSKERQSDGAMERRSVRATEQIKDEATARRSDGAIKQRFRDH